MKNNAQFIFFGLFLVLFSWTACEQDEAVIPSEETLITTLTYTLIPNGGGDVVVLQFQDLDGDGGNAPIITGGTFTASTVYSGTLELFNAAVTPAEDIIAEIDEGREEYQFFYTPNNNVDLDFSYGDVDGQGRPVGILTSLTVGNPSAGTLTITLRHELNKLVGGASSGLIENADGETAFEMTFPVTVQ